MVAARPEGSSWSRGLLRFECCVCSWLSGKGQRRKVSEALVDPCPAQQQLLLAFFLWCLAKCFGVSLLFGFRGVWFGFFLRKNKTALVGSLFLMCHVISVFLKYISDSANVVELNCFPLQKSKLYRAFCHPVSSPAPKRED